GLVQAARVLRVEDYQVELAVGVEVGRDGPVRVVAGRVEGRCLKCAVALAPVNGDAVRVAEHQDQVGLAVAVEVPGRDRRGAGVGGQTGRGSVRAVAGAQEHADRGVGRIALRGQV